MKLIRSLMGRRQFMVAATAASTSALAYEKLAGFLNPDLKTSVAVASEKPETAAARGSSNRYSHLLSPLKIGNVALKNRMIQTQSFPRFLQGPEIFPSEQIINHYTNVAKNGCAVVDCFKGVNFAREEGEAEGEHMAIWDSEDTRVQHYLAQLTDGIHFYESLACMGLRLDDQEGYNISTVPIPFGPRVKPGKELPVEMIQKMIEDTATQAKFYKSLGFDMVEFHMSYHNNILATALSPVYNKRTDKYGGSLENRARFALEIFQTIKKACGNDFLIMAHVSGEEGSGGYTLNDTVQYAKIWEGALDILQLRGEDEAASHPSGSDSEKGKPVTLPYAQAVKESGVKIIVAPVGGFQNLDFNEECIASGKADLIAMARAWIADPRYGKKAYEGRGEDVVPCVLCNKCHGTSGPPISVCTVNPEFGIAHKINRMTETPAKSKRVAVIGGGPAGMKAAITAAERGHKVTLYEKTDSLGGQLRHADFASFQWPYRDFKDYLVRQVKKAGVEVLLNTKATPEMINIKGYDAVVVAAGAEPIVTDIPGGKGGAVLAPIFVYGNKTLGKNVALIESDQIATETKNYLIENGHKVTVIRDKRYADSSSISFGMGEVGGGTAGGATPGGAPADSAAGAPGGGISGDTPFDGAVGVSSGERGGPFQGEGIEGTITGISKGKLTYVDAKGSEKTIQTDTVVVSAGRKPRLDEAVKFHGTAERLFIVGDCREAGTVAEGIRAAFAAASQI